MRGIGSKIAAFYLRDILFTFRIKEPDPQLAPFFQPIDGWVGSAINPLAEGMGDKPPTTDKDRAIYLQRLAAEASVSGAAVNAGLWLLGSQFRLPRTDFPDALRNRGELTNVLERLRGRNEAWASQLDSAIACLSKG